MSTVFYSVLHRIPSLASATLKTTSEYKHKLVQGMELLQLHRNRKFWGVRNCDGNFEAIAINGCQGIKTTDGPVRSASKPFTPNWLAG